MSNHLAGAQSPYLTSHQDNPVDWWPWCPEAFAEAARREAPILLSVGYQACHWCHVMAHESFEDPATAAVLNRYFVAVKVDREERPDIDAVYMSATQALTGHGGWPMTCFLTPAGEPFFCGTYFPPSARHGLPGFRDVLDAIAGAWRDRRGEVLESAATITAHVAAAGSPGEAPIPVPTSATVGGDDRELLAGAVRALRGGFDADHGGFGGAPKFPPSMVGEFLLRHTARTGSPAAAEILDATLLGMAGGGMYDQLGGGFARYSVDAAWVVPHFEKMLYDNAQLLRLYTHRAALGGDSAVTGLAARVARETAAFLLRDLRSREGGFISSLDADTAGQEGLTYVWTPGELTAALGAVDGAWAAEIFAVTGPPTFDGHSWVLQLRAEPADNERLADVRGRLLAARGLRPQPGRDDKVVAAWNGLAIGALAEAGSFFDEPSWVAAARQAAELLVAVHVRQRDDDSDDHSGAGVLLVRTSRDGVAGPAAGVLEDYACVAEGFLTLAAVTGEVSWVRRAQALLDAVLAEFTDGSGLLHDTAAGAESLIARPRDPADNASPSGTSAAAGALLALGSLIGQSRYLDAADRASESVRRLAGAAPRFAGWGLAVLEAAAAGPVQIAVVGAAGDPARAALHREAVVAVGRGAVAAVGDPADVAPAAGERGDPVLALLADRPLLSGAAAAYVCRGFVCDRPVTGVEELRGQLSG